MNTGAEIPQVGLGTWKIRDKDACIRTVKYGLGAGYRHFDTAQIYGNEQFVGEALKNSGVDRRELFITTKIWLRNFRSRLVPSVEKSLTKLQTNYVDLLLLHYPVTIFRAGAWKQLERLYEEGKAKNIGVSNYTIRHLKQLLKNCKVVPAVNQVEIHVYLQQPELLKFCRDNGIVVEAYSPLAHGKEMNNPVISELAKKHKKSNAQIMIRWCVQNGLVVLPKSTNLGRIKENIDIYNFELDNNDMAKLQSLNKNLRTCWDPTLVP